MEKERKAAKNGNALLEKEIAKRKMEEGCLKDMTRSQNKENVSDSMPVLVSSEVMTSRVE